MIGSQFCVQIHHAPLKQGPVVIFNYAGGGESGGPGYNQYVVAYRSGADANGDSKPAQVNVKKVSDRHDMKAGCHLYHTYTRVYIFPET